MVQSIFRYPGGKSKDAPRKEIISRFPQGFQEYREPFVGGGGVFFAIEPKVKRWINDMDEGLIEVYTILRDRADDFINACRQIPPISKDEGKEIGKARLKAIFDTLPANNALERAVRWYFYNRTAFSGKVRLQGWTSFSSPERWNIVGTDCLEKAAGIMLGINITCGDFCHLLEADGEQVFIYLDPPYMCDTERSKSGRLYVHSFEMADHERLAEAIMHCKHQVLLSYDDHPWVREIYKDYYIAEANWTYSVSKPRSKGRELIITNYPPCEKPEMAMAA